MRIFLSEEQHRNTAFRGENRTARRFSLGEDSATRRFSLGQQRMRGPKGKLEKNAFVGSIPKRETVKTGYIRLLWIFGGEMGILGNLGEIRGNVQKMAYLLSVLSRAHPVAWMQLQFDLFVALSVHTCISAFERCSDRDYRVANHAPFCILHFMGSQQQLWSTLLPPLVCFCFSFTSIRFLFRGACMHFACIVPRAPASLPLSSTCASSTHHSYARTMTALRPSFFPRSIPFCFACNLRVGSARQLSSGSRVEAVRASAGDSHLFSHLSWVLSWP